MKFSVMCFNWEPFAYDLSVYERVATEAERLGYDSFFISDHFLRPFLGTSRENLRRHATHEAWSLLSYIAARTSTIRIGTCVTPLPLRHPPTLAKVVATVDHLSNGRVILGVGAGYVGTELTMYGTGESDANRVTRSIESVRIIKKLWTKSYTDFSGKFFTMRRCVLEPKPVQKPHPPIWTGAMHERMIRMTAELCDGWIPARFLGMTLESYTANARAIKARASELGRKVTMGLMGHVLGRGAAAPGLNLGNFEQLPKVIEKYRAAGCEYLTVVLLPPEKTVELMKKLARDLFPSFT